MRRDLKRRIERLEKHREPFSLPWFHLTTLPIDVRTLGPGERIVEDWLSVDNGFAFTRERVTTDPNDQGKRCTPKMDWGRRYFQPPEEAFPALASWKVEDLPVE